MKYITILCLSLFTGAGAFANDASNTAGTGAARSDSVSNNSAAPTTYGTDAPEKNVEGSTSNTNGAAADHSTTNMGTSAPSASDNDGTTHSHP